MRLSEIKGKKAYEVLADLITPIKVLATDEEIRKAANVAYIDALQLALRTHPDELTAILAILDLEDPETYDVTLAVLPRKVMELYTDPDIRDLFMSQSQKEE